MACKEAGVNMESDAILLRTSEINNPLNRILLTTLYHSYGFEYGLKTLKLRYEDMILLVGNERYN